MLSNQGKSSKVFSLPKLPSHRSLRRSTNTLKNDGETQLLSIADRDELENIVGNLSTIAERSEKSLASIKSVHPVRRTSSFHLSKRENSLNISMKMSNSHYEKLPEKNLDLSQSKESLLNLPTRRSLRNIEKFSGIKCSLPSSKTMMPQNCKTFDKHFTPTRTNNNVVSSTEITTPTVTKGQVKSPWRLRFEKFLNHQELTPLSPVEQSKVKISIMNKENRTPSFRPPTRRPS